MEAWDGWPLERFLYFFLAAAYLLVWLQLSLYHWRGAFRSSFMWGPVLYTPLLIAAALALGVTRGDVVEIVFAVIYGIGVAEGLTGVLLHARGVSAYVGGFSLRNFMAGPPVILPLVYAALSGLGLLILYWDRIVDVSN